ncbi:MULTISPECIES: hybrid sensor histidine kinase/response regulator [unclassified Delftia]|uniref:hybrid sensor histidine kinase/response regulator n=1 Tax=unclassified Delftia TaxID=2613839 RepID=UPI00064702D4|nr:MULTISPECIES: PAS domain-containing sensor histidine kinase [unclassified Delftia]MDC2858512.1 PAS domain S-box protein [Delftia sp. DT-2]
MLTSTGLAPAPAGSDAQLPLDPGLAALEAFPDAVFVVGLDGRLARCNRHALSLLEHSGDALEGSVFEDRFVASSGRAGWFNSQCEPAGAARQARLWPLLTCTGRERPVASCSSRVRLGDGSLALLLSVREADAPPSGASQALAVPSRSSPLSSAERSFALLVQSVTDCAIYMLDPEGRIVSWNLGAKRIKGYEEDEVLHTHFSRFYTPEDQQAGLPQAGLRTAVSTGRMEAEGLRVRKDGSRFWASVVIDAIYDEGQLIGFAKVTRDVTERKAAEAQLRQALKMEAIGRFTGGVAHDFNNLLMAVLSSLELLRKRMPPDDRLRSLVEIATRGAQRGASLTQRMMAFARQQELKTQAVDVAVLLTGMQGLLQQTAGPHIFLKMALASDLPRIATDPSQFESSILSLVANARDAMPGGGVIKITAAVETTLPRQLAGLASGSYVCVRVVDTGEGMDEQTLSHVVEPFFTTKGVGKGTGLGLAMVDGLVAQSGGKLVLHSALGSGTTVEMWMPVSKDESTACHLGGQSVQDVGPLDVLLVDDDPLVRANASALLEDLGHRVTTLGAGQEAIDLLARQARFDVVISDYAMPGMNGVELARHIAARYPGLNFILASGFADIPALPPGMTRLAKPYSQDDLRQLLLQLVRA